MTRRPDLAAFSRLRAAVVGDLISDHYLEGSPARLSREAPVVVLAHREERWCAGGAANVARNLAALGASCRVLGIVGRDASGRELLHVLDREDLDTSGVASAAGWQTPTKTRVLAADRHRTPQQVLRIDREPSGPAPREAREALAERVAALAGAVDVLVVSDYGYGALDAGLAHAVDRVAAAGARVVLDPRREIALFARLDAATPNLDELAAATGRAADELEAWPALIAAAAEFGARARARLVLATLGNRGMALVDAEAGALLARVDASGADRVVDVSGAGDTAAATFALGVGAGFDPVHAMALANAAAGQVVMEMGTAVPCRETLAAWIARTAFPEAADGALSERG